MYLPLCISHYVSPTMYLPLCISHYISPTMYLPLCISQNVSPKMYLPLFICHYVWVETISIIAISNQCNVTGLMSWCSENHQNLMILSTERQLQLSMDSAWKLNVPRHNKEKKLLEFDEGASDPQIRSDCYRSIQILYALFTHFSQPECDAMQMICEITYWSCEYNEILISSTMRSSYQVHSFGSVALKSVFGQSCSSSSTSIICLPVISSIPVVCSN
jgi:hypothetical protein